MTTHPPVAMLARYAGGGADLDEAAVWSVEIHLENCADCRARLAGGTTEDTRALLARVAAGWTAASPPGRAARRRRLAGGANRWLVWHWCRGSP